MTADRIAALERTRESIRELLLAWYRARGLNRQVYTDFECLIAGLVTASEAVTLERAAMACRHLAGAYVQAKMIEAAAAAGGCEDDIRALMPEGTPPEGARAHQ